MVQRHDVDGPAGAGARAGPPDLQAPATGVARDPQLGIEGLGRLRRGVGRRFIGLLRGLALGRLFLRGSGYPRRCRGPLGGQRLEVRLEGSDPQGAVPFEGPDVYRGARQQLRVVRPVRGEVGRERHAELLPFQHERGVHETVRLFARRGRLGARAHRRQGD